MAVSGRKCSTIHDKRPVRTTPPFFFKKNNVTYSSPRKYSLVPLRFYKDNDIKNNTPNDITRPLRPLMTSPLTRSMTDFVFIVWPQLCWIAQYNLSPVSKAASRSFHTSLRKFLIINVCESEPVKREVKTKWLIYIYIYIYIYKRIIYTYIYIYMCVLCIYAFMYIYIYICVYVCVYNIHIQYTIYIYNIYYIHANILSESKRWKIPHFLIIGFCLS